MVERRHDFWAGFFLACTTIRPQMVVLLVIFLLAWAIFQKRWRILGGFIISIAGFVFSSMLLVPTWPFDFIRNAIDYSDYVAFGTPLENLLHYLLRGPICRPPNDCLVRHFLSVTFAWLVVCLAGQTGGLPLGHSINPDYRESDYLSLGHNQSSDPLPAALLFLLPLTTSPKTDWSNVRPGDWLATLYVGHLCRHN